MPTRRLSLLVVEDERPLARLWASELERLVEPTLSESLQDARAKLRGRSFDVILLDLNLPDGSGLDLLSEVASRGDDTAVIILTANADLNSAIAALRHGAYDYLTKPCRISELEQHLVHLAQQQRLRDENRALRHQFQIERSSFDLIGNSSPLAEVRRLISKVAPSNASDLISGETGTGKEDAVRLLHSRSNLREMAI